MKHIICPPDCPDRNARCHIDCEKYQAQSAKNKAQKEELRIKHAGEYNSVVTMKKNNSAFLSARYNKRRG